MKFETAMRRALALILAGSLAALAGAHAADKKDKAKADLKQGFRLDQPRAVIAKAFFQGAPIMFQYPINRFDGCPDRRISCRSRPGGAFRIKKAL